MSTHPSKILANLTGQLMTLDIEDVEVGDVIFMGGHLVRRVWTKPKLPSFKGQADEGFLFWQGLSLDKVTDGSEARENLQSAIGSAVLVLRPAAALLASWTKDTGYDVGPHLGCGEAEDLARLLISIGLPELAGNLIYGHAGGDEDPAELDTDDRHAHLNDEIRSREFVAELAASHGGEM